MDEMPEMMLYGCTFKVNKGPKELPTILCVNSEGVTAFEINVKGRDPIICRSANRPCFHSITISRTLNTTPPCNATESSVYICRQIAHRATSDPALSAGTPFTRS